MTQRDIRLRRSVKAAVCLLWLLLFAMLLHRDVFVKTFDIREATALERAERTEFQGIYFRDKKIGYVVNQFIPEQDGRIRLLQEAFMRLNIGGQNQVIELDLQALLKDDNSLDQFDFSFASPFYKMSATGRVSGNEVSFTLDTGSNTITDTVTLSGPPLISTSRRGYLLPQGISEGAKIKIPWFDPISLTGKESVLEYRGMEQVLIHGRVFNLHRFTEQFSGARINSWLDDAGDVIKEESPAGFVFLKEPEFKARSLDDDSSELLAAVAVKVIGSMPDPAGRQQMRYRLSLPADVEFDLDGDRQQFRDSILTVTREQLAPADQVDTAGTGCGNEAAMLAASAYIQSDATAIIAKSAELTAGLVSRRQKTEAIAGWVYRSLEKRPVLGIPDALSTLASGIGDCNEHASLFAALARAAGIPAKIAAGVVYHKGAFYYHAWNEVCLGGRWISLDTTTDQLPADVSHLKFIEGELQEQVRIGALLGTLEIEPLQD